jgi:secreted PhoX family phosphatase
LKEQGEETVSNRSENRPFASILEANLSRRRVLQGGLGLAVTAFFGAPLAHEAGIQLDEGVASATALGFSAITPSQEDTVRVPEGYTATPFYLWGDPTMSDVPAWKSDASNTAFDQAHQAGMHHDGMHYYPLDGSVWGLLVMNHEYTDQGILFPDGTKTWSAEKVLKSQNAHGVSVIEVKKVGGQWTIVRPSSFARRITANTPMRISGPAAGADLLKTAADPTGTLALGTLNNCANGYTPWGTYVACEENWNGYFSQDGEVTDMEDRYGISAGGFGYRWHEFDSRFSVQANPNEPNRFGWAVEVDPFSPYSTPVKRTALGRIKRENASFTVAKNGKVVAYSGDDERFEYIYKFVSSAHYNPDSRLANRDILDSGTLYVARFNDDGTGNWLPLVYGQNGLDASNGFDSQAAVVTFARAAADVVGATPMDRPEWIAVHPTTQEAYVTLTNNTRRTEEQVDAANPRPDNAMGHIIRWRESGGDSTATTFEWDIFVLAGDPKQEDPNVQGNIKGSAFADPDGVWIDPRGVLWIQTDISSGSTNNGVYANLGNNQMLAADTDTGEIRRFLTGAVHCEITGNTQTPDGTAMWINIQHPGEGEGDLDPEDPFEYSSWPDGPTGGRPRSGTILITKDDGGVVGT